jgi:RNA polymerase sigma factor (sigma-70 family)
MDSGHEPPDVDRLLRIAYRMAMRWCQSPADADDVAQEAIVRYVAMATLPANPTAWLFVVIRRLSNRQRMRTRARERAELTFLEGVLDARLDTDLRLDIEVVLSSMTERQRRLLLMLLEGAQSREIAEAFGCNVRDVGQMVARARRSALRVHMDVRKRRR